MLAIKLATYCIVLYFDTSRNEHNYRDLSGDFWIFVFSVGYCPNRQSQKNLNATGGKKRPMMVIKLIISFNAVFSPRVLMRQPCQMKRQFYKIIHGIKDVPF